MLAPTPSRSSIQDALASALYCLGKSLQHVHTSQFGLARAYYWDASFAIWEIAS